MWKDIIKYEKKYGDIDPNENKTMPERLNSFHLGQLYDAIEKWREEDNKEREDRDYNKYESAYDIIKLYIKDTYEGLKERNEV